MEIEFDILDLLQKLHTNRGPGDVYDHKAGKCRGNLDHAYTDLTADSENETLWCCAYRGADHKHHSVQRNYKTVCSQTAPVRCEHGHSASDSQTVRLVVSVRTYIRCVCIGIRTVFSCIQQYWCCGIGEPDGSKEGLEACVATGVSDCVFQAVSVCALSD